MKIKENLSKPIYPVLFFAFPVIHWFAFNVEEGLSITALIVLILVSQLLLFGVNIFASIIFKVFVKSKDIKALNLLFFGIWFFSLGRIWNFFYVNDLLIRHVTTRLIALVGIIFLFCFFLISLNFPKKMPKINYYINILLIGLLLYNVLLLMLHFPSTKMLYGEKDKTNFIVPLKDYKTPNIYFIIFDEFANPETMRKYWNVDVSESINSLKKLGFYIIENSYSVSRLTARSLGSTLNLGYMPFQYALDNEFLLSKCVKALEYKYIHVGTMSERAHKYDFLMYNKFADVNFNYNFSSFPSPYSSCITYAKRIYKTTALKFLDFLQFNHENLENSINKAFEYLQNIVPNMDGHNFVFAHINSPHVPHIFYKDPKIMKQEKQGDKEESHIYKYKGQYVYIADKMVTIAKTILEKEKNPPIIIIQSDHGFRKPQVKTNKIFYEEKRIFNAVYIPENAFVELSQELTPIDTIKTIFKDYIGLDMDSVFRK